jgi:hypothetical protein
MDSARVSIEYQPAPDSKWVYYKSAYGSLAEKTKFNGMAIDMTSKTVRRSGKESEKNRPAAARNLMPPFPGQRVYGTDPRSQGYVAGEILQKRENFSSHRDAPLTAPVPFQKATGISGKGGQGKGTRSRLAPALMAGQTAASKVTGAPPLRPRTEKSRNYRLTGGGLLMEAATAQEW